MMNARKIELLWFEHILLNILLKGLGTNSQTLSILILTDSTNNLLSKLARQKEPTELLIT